jgi:LuxR family transcriptional regulator, maltose regulon positive regulatory protein
MASPLLETKLYVPRPRRGLVRRARLMERLDRGAESKLTLISAPAGFGKTTLLAEWLASVPADGRAVAWLSLDQGDDEPASFWSYLIAALQAVAPGVGGSALPLLQAPQPPSIEAGLAALLNDMSALPNDVVLVLDDYHAIDAHLIGAGMAYLLEHLPHQVHLVIATRADPALPLGRLRGRGELVEIRAADLRFTPDEAAAYLNGMIGLDLAARDIAALEERTEGWIAALQLAALSIQGRDDIAGFIAGFSGDDRYIVDYLVEEVLGRQPERVRSFLLQTSVLGRLSGPLCDAVTGQEGGRAMLEALDRGNLFLIPLDDRRRWYRYHHLFADVLRAHLLDEASENVQALHRRASDWYEQNGERAEAIGHAIAGEDLDRAADLVELAIPALRQGRQEATLRRWVDSLPDRLFRVRPVLALAYVGSRLVSGDLEGVEARLREAERWVGVTRDAPGGTEPAATGMVVVDEEAFRNLPGAIALFRIALALASGDIEGTVTHARHALGVMAQDDHLGRGGAAGFLGLAAWTSGDLDAAHRWWTDAAASLQRAGHLPDVLGGSIALADIRIAQGRLREAMQTFERGLQLATSVGGAVPIRGTPDMHVGMSELLRERNDLPAARQQLHLSSELGDHAGLAQNAHRSRLAMARIREADGDLDGAIELLDEAERLYAGDYFPDVRPIPAMRARLWIAQGRLSEALAWVRERDLTTDDELSYLREFDHITLARLLLARSRGGGADSAVGAALGLLGRLLEAAERGGRWRSLIEILVLQALALQSGGDVPAALVALERALTLAEPEGFVRIFVDEGPAMAALLKAAARHGMSPTYVRRLLGAFGPAQDVPRVDQALVEPLSERELEVLRLLASDLDGPEIARELVVSLNTVRSHTRSIYAKLGVNDRRAAVRRAAELDLLARPRDR